MTIAATPETIAHHSVVALHDLIEAVFTGLNADLAYAQLRHHFDADFKMVTTAGVKVEVAAVRQLFHRGKGKRPGLTITVSDVVTLSVLGSEVWVQYQETHTLAGVVTQRLSVAQINAVSMAEWQWRYLHETPVLA